MSATNPSGFPASTSFLFFLVGIFDIQALSLLCLDKNLKIYQNGPFVGSDAVSYLFPGDRGK